MSTSQAAASSTPQSIVKDAHPFSRSQLEGLLIKRFFYAPAFEHYGGEPVNPNNMPYTIKKPALVLIFFSLRFLNHSNRCRWSVSI
jgi:hypothetical protein